MKKKILVSMVIPVAIVLSACGSTQTTTKKAVSVDNGSNNSSSYAVDPVQEFVQANKSDMVNMYNDLQMFADDTSTDNVDIYAVRTDCQLLIDDATALQNDGPINDPVNEGAWASVLSNLVSGGQACVSGIDTDNPDLITQAATDFNNASTALDEMNISSNA